MDDATLSPMPPPRSSSPALPTQTQSQQEPRSDNNSEVGPASSTPDTTPNGPLKEEVADNEGKLEGGKQKRKRTR